MTILLLCEANLTLGGKTQFPERNCEEVRYGERKQVLTTSVASLNPAMPVGFALGFPVIGPPLLKVD